MVAVAIHRLQQRTKDNRLSMKTVVPSDGW